MSRFFSLNTLRIILTVLLLLGVMGTPKGYADEVTITGSITQSIQDNTGPAINNTSLNKIQDQQGYTLNLNFNGSITGPGTYQLTSGLFSVPAALASEGSFTSISFTVTPDGMSDDISLLGCLLTGPDCFTGNSLSLNFSIPSSGLNSMSSPLPIFQLSPALDLSEDGGGIDIQADVSGYSYTPTPEPASLALYGTGLLAVALARRKRQRKRPSS